MSLYVSFSKMCNEFIGFIPSRIASALDIKISNTAKLLLRRSNLEQLSHLFCYGTYARSISSLPALMKKFGLQKKRKLRLAKWIE